MYTEYLSWILLFYLNPILLLPGTAFWPRCSKHWNNMDQNQFAEEEAIADSSNNIYLYVYDNLFYHKLSYRSRDVSSTRLVAIRALGGNYPPPTLAHSQLSPDSPIHLHFHPRGPLANSDIVPVFRRLMTPPLYSL